MADGEALNSDDVAGAAPTGQGPESGLGFDPDALRAKYRAERDKRLRQGAHGETPVRGQPPFLPG